MVRARVRFAAAAAVCLLFSVGQATTAFADYEEHAAEYEISSEVTESAEFSDEGEYPELEESQAEILEALPETETSQTEILEALPGTVTGSQEIVQEEAPENSEESLTEIETEDSELSDQRQQLVEFALQFLGGAYKDKGNDPHTGVDCSGFTKYVMEHGAGVVIGRSSVVQADQGRAVSADEMKPGDLIFYGKNGRINHVAMYIGDGQVVHASTYKTGIKISQWDYRTPLRIRNVLD